MLFYPGHDIALAHGVRPFTPPRAAVRLAEDLASISDVWNAPFLAGEESYPVPWGWDYDTCRCLQRRYHVPASHLPSLQQLAVLRALSSRQTVLTLLACLRREAEAAPLLAEGLSFAHAPVFLATEDALTAYVSEQEALGTPFVLKTLWSSSGRGLMPSVRDGVPTHRATLLHRATVALRHMGGLMGETWVEHKVHDFALLFFAAPEAHAVRYLGLSLFDNDASTGGLTYQRGYLLSNEAIRERLGVSAAWLALLVQAFERSLTTCLAPLLGQPWPLGYLGVDMMQTQKGIVPVIELNLRCTMGVVCRLYYDQHPAVGTLRVAYNAQDDHFSLQIENHEN